MKSKFAFVWFAVSLALGALLVLEHRKTKAVQGRLETVQLQVEKIEGARKSNEAKTVQLESENLRLRGETRALEMALSSARTVQPGASPQPQSAERSTPAAAGGKSPGSIMGDMFKDPAMRKMIEAQQQVMVEMMFDPLIKELQLPGEQAEEFKKLLLDRQMENVKRAGDMFDQSNTNRAALGQELAELQKAHEEEIRTFLGEDNYAKYQDYSQTIGERMMLNQFSQQTKLEPDQMDQLIQIIRDEKQNSILSGQPNMNDPSQGMEVLQSEESANRIFAQQESLNAQVLERARTVLSEEQLNSFASFQTNQLRMQRIGIEMARKMMQPQQPEGTSP